MRAEGRMSENRQPRPRPYSELGGDPQGPSGTLCARPLHTPTPSVKAPAAFCVANLVKVPSPCFAWCLYCSRCTAVRKGNAAARLPAVDVRGAPGVGLFLPLFIGILDRVCPRRQCPCACREHVRTHKCARACGMCMCAHPCARVCCTCGSARVCAHLCARACSGAHTCVPVRVAVHAAGRGAPASTLSDAGAQGAGHTARRLVVTSEAELGRTCVRTAAACDAAVQVPPLRPPIRRGAEIGQVSGSPGWEGGRRPSRICAGVAAFNGSLGGFLTLMQWAPPFHG